MKIDGSQNLKRLNIELLIFRNFEIAKIEIRKNELFEISNFKSKFSNNII